MPGDPHVTKESFRAKLERLVSNFAANEAELTRRENRPYEPASALLERIRTQRQITQSGQPPSRKRRRM